MDLAPPVNHFLSTFSSFDFAKRSKIVSAGNSMSTACQVNKPTLDNVTLDCHWVSGLIKVTFACVGDSQA